MGKYNPRDKVNMSIIYGGSFDEIIHGVPTGRTGIIIYSIGYGNKVYKLQDVFLPGKFVNYVTSHFSPYQTLYLSIDLSNYAGTGIEEDRIGEYTPTTATKYIHELVVGSVEEVSLFDPARYSREEVNALFATYKKQQAALGVTKEEQLVGV